MTGAKFHQQHYYSLAKTIREMREAKTHGVWTGVVLNDLEEILCAKFAADNPLFNSNLWHEKCESPATLCTKI